MFLRILAFVAGLSTAAAHADCVGPSLLDELAPTEREALRAAAEEPHAEGLLWRASRGKRQVTLVGTMHLGDSRLGAVLDAARPHLDDARLVLLEATAEELARIEALAAEDPRRLFVLDGPTLVERLSPQDWAAVSEAARTAGVPGFMASQFRPYYLALLLGVPPCAMPALLDGAPGLDAMLEEGARERGIPVAALEPYDTVLDAFSSLPEEDALAGLVATARAPELNRAATVALLELYFAGRTAEAIALNGIVVDRMPGLTPEQRRTSAEWFERELLEARNEAWIPEIEAAARAERSVLVAVGAAHLPGERGVLALLEEAGWSVRRLEP